MNIVSHFINKISEKNLEVHSCLIYYQKQLVYESYSQPYHQNQAVMMYSISKTFVSLAIGYLIEEGKLTLKTRVKEYFDDLEGITINKKLTIEHLLTMLSGTHHEQMIMFSDDWIKQYFSQPFYYLPGTHFHYNSMNSYILSVIITKITHLKLVDYLDLHLFQPLNIPKPKWDEDALGYNIGGWGLYLTSRDLMKVSVALLEYHPTLPLNYLHEMVLNHAQSFSKNKCHYYQKGYGYHCWLNGEQLGYRMDGVFGQFAIIVPSLDLVVITTANVILSHLLLECIFNDFILLLPNNPVQPTHLQLKNSYDNLPSIQFEHTDYHMYYQFKNNGCSILPLAIMFLKHMSLSHANGFSFEFFERFLYLNWHEGQMVQRIYVSLTQSFKMSKLKIQDHCYDIMAFGYFKKSQLNVTILFLEFPHTRFLQFDFLTPKKIVVKFNETPSVNDLLEHYHYLLTFTPFSSLNNWVVEQAYHLINPTSVAFRQKKKGSH
ncbi:MAG: serine hydrolase [Erysipelotrichaceae bacterium]|nr:serine hydrolase [Erysipelotrichaceae bacterium]